MKKFAVLIICLSCVIFACSGDSKKNEEKEDELSQKLSSVSDSESSAIEIIEKNYNQYDNIYGTGGYYVKTFVQRDAYFSYWQATELWGYTYIVEFGHQYVDDGSVFNHSFLVDTNLNAYINITNNRVYSDDLLKSLKGSFEKGKSSGSESEAIEIIQTEYSNLWATINQNYFTSTATRKKTKQLYWSAKKVRAHTFIVSITSMSKENQDNLKAELCGANEEECDVSEKILPGRYFYVNTMLRQSKEITNNNNFKHLMTVKSLFPKMI